MHEYHNQYPEKLNICTEIIGYKIIGLFFIKGNLNGTVFLNLLEYSVVLEVVQLFLNPSKYFHLSVNLEI